MTPTGTYCYQAFDENATAVTLCVDAATGVVVSVAGGDAVPGYDPSGDMDATWILIAGCFVFFMQTGFGMLEAGCVQEKNVINILFKNVMDASIAALIFAALGYGFAYGEAGNSFIGAGNFFLTDFSATETGFHNFFFQWTFSAAAATIVAGSVAERCSLGAYFVYSIFLTGFTYPVVVHWIWASDGWLSAFNPEPSTLKSMGGGMIDFAGSGVVHMTGGVSGLIAATIIGPRTGRFTGEGNIKPHSHLLACLGVFILWFGWYGFNCGSTLAVAGGTSTLAARVATTTTLSAASGACTGALLSKILKPRKFDIMLVLNGVLAGLVSITAPCPVVGPGAAILIGSIGTVIYKLASMGLQKARIDDPLDAFPVHGAAGFWGVLAVAIFATEENKVNAAYLPGDGTFGIQLCGALAIIAWCFVTITPLFLGLNMAGFLRVNAMEEAAGLDASEHGATAYTPAYKEEGTRTDFGVAPAEAEA